MSHERASRWRELTPNIICNDTNSAKLPDRIDALVDDLRSVLLHTRGQLKLVFPSLCVLATASFNTYIDAARYNLMNLGGYALLPQCFIVDSNQPGDPRLCKFRTPIVVDANHQPRTFLECPDTGHEANWAKTPYGNSIALEYSGVRHAMV
jgi:hypothetical protein